MCEHTFVRWDNLLETEEEARRPPGYREPAVVRTFDAPEALDTRFYEVRAKSALNRVPERSRMPFRWTINPYRGCSHACSYCVSGRSSLLMADGRTQPNVGGLVWGTGSTARTAAASTATTSSREVRDKWSTMKPALSGHARGRDRVGCKRGSQVPQRPRLEARHRRDGRIGPTSVPDPEQRAPGHRSIRGSAIESPDYRRGYLCGLVRGDAWITSRRFRLALSDLEALRRAKAYLRHLDVDAHELPFAAAAGNRGALEQTRTARPSHLATITDAVRWPGEWPSTDWSKGLPCGIFDAEGSCSASGAPHRNATTDHRRCYGRADAVRVRSRRR